jgi:hypothetical protein
MSRYKIKFADVEHAPDGLVKALMPKMVEIVRERAVHRAPKRSGKLASRIIGALEDAGLQGKVISKAPHSFLIHEGTKAHDITLHKSRKNRSKRKALTIPSGGRVFLRHSAHVRGVRANPFLTNALADSKGDIANLLRDGERFLETVLK